VQSLSAFAVGALMGDALLHQLPHAYAAAAASGSGGHGGHSHSHSHGGAVQVVNPVAHSA
jgi:hypothetical protein